MSQATGGVEPRHLLALVAVAEEGTFTDAAIRLGVSQPVVSRTIVALEALVDARLVERTTRSAALTEPGRRAYQAALVALAAIGDVADAAHGRTRPLRLGFAWSALGRHTSEVLRRWRAAHPAVALEVHRFDERLAGLPRGSVDVAVIRGGFDAAGLHSRAVFAERRMAAVPVTHPLAGATGIRLAQLTGETVALTAYGTTTLELWPADIRPARALLVDNTDVWLTEIAGGQAVGVTAESTAVQHSHTGVAFVPLTDAGPIEVHLAWPAVRTHPATAEFVALVEQVAAEQVAPGQGPGEQAAAGPG